MTIQIAFEIMATGSATHPHRCGTDGAIATIANALETNMSEADLCDWIANGEWNGTETIQQIQAELNEIDAECELIDSAYETADA